ncbi:NADP-specific glutamate dehydrogenase [Carnobacterium gallinarum]|uniref:NADP-specific glutamate dehydrogenase n=1 Tax=Carnobacterium gallinarum TaxID=2749 RepID=UPI0005503E93|nr:NADP-specific glutamate dehydrogenase [Carnobacterium gallinarum]
MENATDYIAKVYKKVEQRDPNQVEFLQAVKEFFDTIEPVIARHPKLIEENILERIVEPERIFQFRVPWTDDQGNVQVNRAFRVQFSSAIGPYKGGLRFHPSVNQSIVKFLGFEQIFKNSLTGLPIGGGKGGSDFNPKGKSDFEVMRFCQSFMTELQKYIGPDVDVPAGDIGVGGREIGYLFGQYKKLNGFGAGVLTGKPIPMGGSLARTEATGYGLVYFTDEMLKDAGKSFAGEKVVVSGSGNVAIYAIEKVHQLGGTVIACSDSNGYILDLDGIKVDTVKRLKEVERKRISEYVTEHPTATYVEGSVWELEEEFQIALPSATQNEISGATAEKLVKQGVYAVAEGANMPSDLDAIKVYQTNKVLYGPAKAANAGGVAVSALEMSQNSIRLSWTFEEVDSRLKDIMTDIYVQCRDVAKEYGAEGDFVTGANIAGFLKVSEAMLSQGVL